MGAATKGSPTDFIPTMNVGSEPTIATSNKTGNRLLSGLGRISYDYKGKYLMNLNFRYDGTSKLVNNRWFFFWYISWMESSSRGIFSRFENIEIFK